ncbi:MAG: winged helix DNA-binding domain-containing protein [Eubacteriales bacterium]|nr:winged helix DNA-binding domain-containing protein [Eubacteriales bacterium]
MPETLSIPQWKQTVLYRQHLTNPAKPLDVSARLNGLQAQFASAPYYALKARCEPDGLSDWGRGLVRSYGVRGTLHTFPEADLPLYVHPDMDASLRDMDSLRDDAHASGARKGVFVRIILESLKDGPKTRQELKDLCAHAGMTGAESLSVFNAWGGLIRLLAVRGRICQEAAGRGRYRLCPPFEIMDREKAALVLARRYFTHFGPASLRDASYYFQKPQARMSRIMDQLPLREYSMDGVTRYDLPGEDGESALPDISDILFLAGFDQLLLGFQKKANPFLPEKHLRGIFTMTGIIHPVLLVSGEVAGRWNVNAGKLAVTLFEPMKKRRLAQVERAAQRYFGNEDLRKISVVNSKS